VRLPQVCEVSRAALWWENGQLGQWLKGGYPTPLLEACLEILKGAIADVEADMLSDKGKQ